MASPRGQDQHAGVLVTEPGRRRGRYGRAASNRRATDAAFFWPRPRGDGHHRVETAPNERHLGTRG